MIVYAEIVFLLLVLFIMVYNKSFAIESSRGHRFLNTDRSDLGKLRPRIIKYNKLVIILVGLVLVGLLSYDLISAISSPAKLSGGGKFSWALFAFLFAWTAIAIAGVVFFLRRRATSLDEESSDEL